MSIQLRLSEENYQTLMEMMQLAMDVADWNQKESSRMEIAKYHNLSQLILEQAHHSSMSDWVTLNEESGQYEMREDREGVLFSNECYDEFREENFWEELVLRMSDRDLIRAIGQEAWDALEDEQKRAKASNWEEMYWNEFARNGIDHLHLIVP